MIAALSPMATDLYLPAIPAMAADFGSDIQLVELSISAYMLGFAAGQLFGAPISDRLGRRPVTLFGLLLFLAATALIIACQSSEQLLALRFMQALGGGSAAVNVMASIGDLFAEKDAAIIYSKIHTIVLVSPLIAPIIGATLVAHFPWQSTFTFLVLYALTVLFLARVTITETLRPDPNKTRTGGVLADVATDYWAALTRPMAVWFNIVTGFAYACFFVFLTDAAFLFIEYFDRPTHDFPLYFGACILTLGLANRLNQSLITRFALKHLIPIGHVIQLLATCSLLVYVRATTPELPVTLSLLAVSLGANALIIGNSTARYISLFDKRRGTASAVAGTIQFSIGAAVSIGISLVHDGTPRTMAIGMLATALISAGGTFRIAWRERHVKSVA